MKVDEKIIYFFELFYFLKFECNYFISFYSFTLKLSKKGQIIY